MTSKDGIDDATVEELAASADNPHEDVAEATETEETETEEEKTEEVTEDEDADALSDADLASIDKYGKFDEDERKEKIEKMYSSGRKDQVATAKMLMESFDLEFEEESKNTTDEAVTESLKKLGLTPEYIAELQEQQESAEINKSVKVWAETLGIDAKLIRKNKDFVKAYHRSNADTKGKVDHAIKAYLEKNPVSSKAKKEATLKLSSTEKTGSTQKKKVDFETYLEGKSLDEIDLSMI